MNFDSLLKRVPSPLLPYTLNLESSTIDGLGWVYILAEECQNKQGNFLIDEIKTAVRNGIGLQVGNAFDLSFLGEDLKRVRLLLCGENVSVNWHAVQQMDQLEALQTPRKGQPADLGSLPSLRELWAFSDSYASALAAPHLQSAFVQSGARLQLPGLSDHLRKLRVVANSADLVPILDSKVSELTLLLRTANLQMLVNQPTLRQIAIEGCRDLRGLQALKTLPDLERLVLRQVKKIDDPSVLDDLVGVEISVRQCFGLNDFGPEAEY